MTKQRVIAYIDGFNLYYGMRSKHWQRYYWLNIQLLAQNLLRKDQVLVRTKYFTSMVSSTPTDPNKNKRQTTYLEALGTLQDFDIYYGHYLHNPVDCKKCGSTWHVPSEKMTDVNIAVEMLTDAFRDSFDVAFLMSADSDLTPLIERVPEIHPEKRIVVAFPPKRVSKRLREIASASFSIGRRMLAKSQFPDEVRKSDSCILRRPQTWT